MCDKKDTVEHRSQSYWERTEAEVDAIVAEQKCFPVALVAYSIEIMQMTISF